MSDIDEKLVEEVARAFCEEEGLDPEDPLNTITGETIDTWQSFKGHARAAIAAVAKECAGIAKKHAEACSVRQRNAFEACMDGEGYQQWRGQITALQIEHEISALTENKQ